MVVIFFFFFFFRLAVDQQMLTKQDIESKGSNYINNCKEEEDIEPTCSTGT